VSEDGLLALTCHQIELGYEVDFHHLALVEREFLSKEMIPP
jgi:hypothetical protein